MTDKNLDTFDSETGKIIPLKVSWLKQDTMFLLPVLGRWKPECCVPKAAVAHTMTMGYGVKHELSDLRLNMLPTSLPCLWMGFEKHYNQNHFIFPTSKFQTDTLETVQQCMAEASRLSAVSRGKPLAQLWQQKNDSTCRLWGLWGWRNDKPCMKTLWLLFAPFKAERDHRTKTEKPTRD